MKKLLEPVLFASSESWVRRGLEGGITDMIIDWENKGKAGRQQERDTEINFDTPQDLERLARLRVPKRILRINAMGPWTAGEIELALECGVTCIFLPMVSAVSEVEHFLECVNDRCETGILVETDAAVSISGTLGGFPLNHVYVGLNDLAISRGNNSIFRAAADGTLDRLRENFSSIVFGFGGITCLDRGTPIPFRLLLAEMVRLDIDFSFCRRSFKRDTKNRDIRAEIVRIHAEQKRLRTRTPAEINRDREIFCSLVEKLEMGGGA